MPRRGIVHGRFCTLYTKVADWLGIETDTCICPESARKDDWPIPEEPIAYIERVVEHSMSEGDKGPFPSALFLAAFAAFYYCLGTFFGWYMWG